MHGRNRHVVMLGTDFSSPGGITAVVRAYAAGGLFARWQVRFLPTYRLNTVVDKLSTAATALLRFTGWLLTGRVAAVHAHTAARGSFWRKSVFLLLARAAGAKTILHLHDGTFPSYYKDRCGPLARWSIRAVLARMDRVVALSPGWARCISEIEARAQVVVIANPVVVLPIPCYPRAGQVLFLGRLWRDKGIFDLLDAAILVVKAAPTVKFVCAGDGDIPALQAMVNEKGMARNFEFPGWVDGAAKDALLASTAVFVLPSYFEGLPIGMLEAMVNGIPVVASTAGGIPEALGNDAGILVTPGDVAGLAAALIRLLDNPRLREQMGQAGRLRASREFARDVVLDRVGALYKELGLMPTAVGAGNFGKVEV
jgi:glycosyltransferase involved in cell wall biosynthesis